jgi:outer membrane receptor for ferrienterochelin and colicins
MHRFLMAITLAGALPALAVAQDTTRAHPVDSITVTAERRPVSTSATSAIVRVVDPARWQNRAAPDLPTLLRDIPGLQIDPVVGSGNGISIEGLGSDRVQVLLDGAPVEGRLNNQLDLTRIDPSELSRVEVVDGPQSTLYGSSALGGVINLITRIPDGSRAELSSEGGSFGQFDEHARISALEGATGLSLDVGHRRIDVSPGLSQDTPGSAERWDLMGRVLAPLGAATLDVRAMHTRENQQYREAYGPSLSDNQNHNDQTDVLASVGFNDDATRLRAHVSTYDHTLDVTLLPDGAQSSDPQTQRMADLELIQRAHFAAAQWVLGARAEHEWIRSNRLADTSESNTLGAVYGSAEWTLAPPVLLSAGTRLTASQRWGTDLAPRVGLVWRGPGGFYAKAGVARGFRAPAFTEQFADFLNAEAFYAVQGNVNLKPETSWNVTGEAGVNRAGVHAYLRGFGNRLRNFIEPVFVGTDGQIADFTYQNVGAAETSGAEVGATVTRGVVTVEASYAYLHTKDDSTGQPLLGRAAHTVRGAVTLAHRQWSLTAEAIRTSALPLSQDPSSGDIITEGASPRVNLRAGFEVDRAWRVTGGVDNVANDIPVNAIGGFGRRWFAGLAWGGRW